MNEINTMQFSVLMSVYQHDNAIKFKFVVKSIFSSTIPPAQLVLVIDGPINFDLMNVIEEITKLYPVKNCSDSEKCWTSCSVKCWGRFCRD